MVDTALHRHLAAYGAVFADDRGVALPRHFGDPAAEYAALREQAALLDLGFRTLVRAVGADRVAFLQGMLTADVAALAPGHGCPALLLTIQGRVTADVRVAALAEPVTLLGLEGPAAAQLLGPDAAALPAWAHTTTAIAGVTVRALRASEVRGPGFVLHVPAAAATEVWSALATAGARPCGMEALEGRRVEVGVPRIGLDMDGSTLALEVPVEEAISQTKGCYLGQEVVARGTARGHVNRRLMGLVFAGAAPAPGAALLHDGKTVGRVTSVAHAFGLGAPAGLGFVRREHWEPGTVLAAGSVTARVARWPLA